MSNQRKDYLGDSVYVEWLGYAVVLTTQNGLPTDPSNTIELDGYGLEALERFVKRMKALDADKAPV